MDAGEVEDEHDPGPRPVEAAEGEDQSGQGDDQEAADQADEGRLPEVLAGQRRRAVLVLQPQGEEAREGEARQEQQVDQVERFGKDGEVLAGLFLGEPEVIVRRWH